MSELPAPVDAQLPVGLPEKFSLTDLAAVARDMAMDLYELPVLLAKHKLNQEQFDRLRETPFFKRTLEKLVVEWSKIESTEDRIKYQSLTGLETALPTLAASMIDGKENLPARVETAKLFAKLGKVDTPDKDGAGADKFVININVGGKQPVRIEKDITPHPASEGAEEVPALSKG